MPITVSHQLSMTTPDDPAYENKPSDWNRSHAFTANMTGSEISGAFSNLNGISFGLNGGGAVTASYTVPSTAGLVSGVNLSAGTTSNNASAFTFSDGGGVSFGMNGSVITASAPAAGGGLTNIRVSAGTTSNLLSALTFSNTNGISFGLDAGTLTAQHNALTSQSNQAVSAANGSSAFQTLSFANSNGVSWSTAAQGIIATVKTDYLTTARASNDAIGLNTAQSNVTWTANSAGLSLDARGYAGTGTSATNASITLNSNGLAISVAAPGGGGNFSAGVSNVGNTGGDTGVSGTRLVLVGSQNITLNQATDANGLTVSFSGGAGAAGNTGFISAGAATASLGTVVFSNSNGVSFGVNGQTVTASHNGLTQQSTQPVAVSGQNGSYAFSTLSLSNANGISFGTSAGSAITASHNGLTSQSNQALSAANGSFAFQTASFSNANGVSFVTAAGSAIQASVETSYAASNHSHGNPTLFLTNLSGTTASASNGFTLSLSAAAGGGGGFSGGMSTQGNTAGTTGVVSNQLIFVGSQGVSLSQSVNGASGTLSIIGPATSSLSATGALSASSNGATISLGVGTVTASAASNTTQASSGTINLNGPVFAGAGGVSVGISNGSVVISGGAGGGATPVASASNGSFSFTTLAFSNANNVTFGTSAGSIITASVAAPGAAAENNAINLLGANTAGNTTVTGSTLGFSGLNITLSGTNNSQMVISAPATSSLIGGNGISISTAGSTISVLQATYSNWEPIPAGNNTTFSSLGQNSFYLQKLKPNENYAFNNIEVRMSGSFVSSTNSQVVAHTINYGLYSLNGATYSSIATSQMAISASYNSNTAMGITISQGGASYTTSSGGTAIASLITGLKHLYLPFTSTMTNGVDYGFGINISSATTVGTSPFRMALLNQTIINNLTAGKIHATTILASNASFVGDFNQGVGSVTTGAMPSSIAESAMTNAVSQARLYLQLD